LHTLHLEDTQVPKATIEKLKKQLPQCKIYD